MKAISPIKSVRKFFFLGAIVLCAPASIWTAPIEGKPNIILILADDVGYEGLGVNGGTTYDTPNLDNMAKNGVNFVNCYATPTCTPSRVNIMSGQYPHHNGWTLGIWDMPGYPPVDWTTVPSFASMLKSAGYKTAVSGKWQLAHFSLQPNHATDAGFDEHCLWVYRPLPTDGLKSRYYQPWIWENGALREDYTTDANAYGPDIHNKFLLDFMEKNKDTTFFAYYTMNLPHRPFHYPPGYDGTYGTKIQAMMNYADVLVGKIIQKTVELGIDNKTLILFTGDNGFEIGVESEWNDMTIIGRKHTVCNVATHVPLVAYWPGVSPANSVVTDMIEFADFLPTLYSFGGGNLFEGAKVDGRSFANQILTGENTGGGDWSFALAEKALKLITDGNYTLHSGGRFYDIKTDYIEATNIPVGTGTAEAEAARIFLQEKLDNIEENFVDFPLPR